MTAMAIGLAMSLLPDAASAEDELPDGVPQCPPTLAEAPLFEQTSGASIAPDGSGVTLNCAYLAGQGGVTPRYDFDTGIYRNWGSASFTIRILIGDRRRPCPADAGVRTYADETRTWPSGLTGSWLGGGGNFPSATHNAEATWAFNIEDGLTPELVESTALGFLAQLEPLSTPCEPPDPDAPIGPAGCPAAIGGYILFEGHSTPEPEIIETSHSVYQRVECVYQPPYYYEGRDPDEDLLHIRAGWISEPVSLHPTLDREGETCTSLRVPVDRDDDPYTAESLTHVARVTVSRGDGDSTAIEAALESIIGHLEGIASLCPVDDTETTEPTEVIEPTESGGETCSPQGTVTDHAGEPMPGLRVQLRLGDEVADQRVTDEDGWYQFSDLGFLAEAYGFDPAADPYEVAVLLRDAVEGAGRFEIRYGPDGVLPEVRRGPLTVEDDPACLTDFDFASIDGEYIVIAGPDDLNQWKSLAHGYQGIRKAHGFALDILDTPLQTPLSVYLFCQGNPPGVHGSPCGRIPAGFLGGFTTEDEVTGPPFISFNRPFSRWLKAERPINGEYHEFGHALMADAFGGFMPTFPQSANHAGYRNPSSTDSWTEGFAEWFATQVSRHVDGNTRWWLYPSGSQVISLEDDRVVTDNQGKDEELAIAGILVDMVDGDADYTAPTARQLTITGYQVFENPDEPGRMMLGVEIRNDTPGPQTDIGVKADFGGIAGLFSTRVDGFVDPKTLEPGASGISIIRVPTGMGESDIDTIKVVGLGVGDDDAVARTAPEVWQAILSYRSTSEHSRGFVMDTAELYEALHEAFPADAAAIDDIFVAHGIFADRDPRNNIRDATEDIGVTSPDGTRIRLDLAPAEVFDAVVDTGAVQSHVLVQVLYPQPRDARSYAYTAVPDGDGVISVAVPPASTGARIRLAVYADGHIPALLPDIEATTFWDEAAANDYTPFLTYAVTLPAGDPLAEAVPYGSSEDSAPWLLMVLAAAALALTGSGAWWWRSRRGNATAPALPPAEE